MQEYLDAIRTRVCAGCIDAVCRNDEFVRCGLPPGQNCPVEVFLPQIIEVVESVNSPLIEDYIDVLRDKVCVNCEHSVGEKCELREKADCALDRYFMMVAEAIEVVILKKEAEQQTVGIP